MSRSHDIQRTVVPVTVRRVPDGTDYEGEFVRRMAAEVDQLIVNNLTDPVWIPEDVAVKYNLRIYAEWPYIQEVLVSKGNLAAAVALEKSGLTHESFYGGMTLTINGVKIK